MHAWSCQSPRGAALPCSPPAPTKASLGPVLGMESPRGQQGGLVLLAGQSLAVVPGGEVSSSRAVPGSRTSCAR